jgi:hypothetical protein
MVGVTVGGGTLVGVADGINVGGPAVAVAVGVKETTVVGAAVGGGSAGLSGSVP